MTIPDYDFMMESSGSTSLMFSPDVEIRIVTELIRQSDSNLKEGKLYYLISNRWYRSWLSYVGKSYEELYGEDHSSDFQHLSAAHLNEAKRPGPIDNTDLVRRGIYDCTINGLEIRRCLKEGRDYVLVPAEVWDNLYDWYKGGPALPRKLIAQKKFCVEVYLLSLIVIDSRDDSETIIQFSKKSTVSYLRMKVYTIKEIKGEKASIWDYFNKEKQSVLDSDSQTLEELNLQMDQHILLEVHGPATPTSDLDLPQDFVAPVALVPLTEGAELLSSHSSEVSGHRGSSSSGSDKEDRNTAKTKKTGGLRGLYNLGNTCYLNSALQCLVHTPPFVEYFLQDYSGDINKKNPLGTQGDIATTFGELLQKLWSSPETTIAPRVFKGKLAQLADQFSGCDQHDSQELLAFILDGLHEDLNRVKIKPYLETKDFDGLPDVEVADECWRYHKARNDSLIVDVFQGQYKSTLVCPDCGKISIVFDPFMCLSLPLPSIVNRSMTVTVFYGDGRGLPMPYTVTVQSHGRTKDLVSALAEACSLESYESLVLVEVYDHQIDRYFYEHLEYLTSIKNEDYLVAFRFAERDPGGPKLEIIHRSLEMTDQKELERKVFGTPLLTFLPEVFDSGFEIDEAVSTILSPFKMNYESANDGSQLSEEEEEEETSSEEGGEGKELSFQLFLTDDRSLSCQPINRDSAIKYSSLIRVFLDWNEKECELYDVSYIKDLPPVNPTPSTKKPWEETISLFSCLEAFETEEPLGPNDMWYCPSCKEHRQATKKLDLWRLPEVIVFHLKRFSLNNKLFIMVDFPIHNLDLSKYAKINDGKPYLYNLYAVINHYGGLDSGHYTAYAKLDEKRWYHFNDTRVNPISEEDIRTSAAYLLFYQRVENNKDKASVSTISEELKGR